MDQTQPIMLRLIASAVNVAKKAGDEVRNITKTGLLGVVDKGVEDFQTEADRIAQRMIVASLSKTFPKCKIVGEEDLPEDEEADRKLIVQSFDEDILKQKLPEQYANVRDEDITIWVDPLDGTKEFITGFLDHVTVLIGISMNGKSVAGIIHQPFYGYKQGSENLTGRTMWGLVGMGCYGIETKDLPSDKLIITSTASHRNQATQDSLEAINPNEILRVGGAGHKVLLVIEGRAHSYVFTSNGCKKWDTCAPEAILESYGGCLTDSLGNRLEYETNDQKDYHNYLGIIASRNKTIHDSILAKIPENVKSSLLAARNVQRAKF